MVLQDNEHLYVTAVLSALSKAVEPAKWRVLKSLRRET